MYIYMYVYVYVYECVLCYYQESGGILAVNYDTELDEVLREIRNLTGPLLSLTHKIPNSLRYTYMYMYMYMYCTN